MDLRWSILAGYGPLFLSGLWNTILLTLIAIAAGLMLGVALGLVSSSRDAPQRRMKRWPFLFTRRFAWAPMWSSSTSSAASAIRWC